MGNLKVEPIKENGQVVVGLQLTHTSLIVFLSLCHPCLKNLSGIIILVKDLCVCHLHYSFRVIMEELDSQLMIDWL